MSNFTKIIECIFENANIKYIKEYRFDKKRRFRFDYAIIEYKIGIELEGGSWIMGRHVRGLGYRNDCEKYNLANSQGWFVFRYTTDMINDYPEQIINNIMPIIKSKMDENKYEKS